MDSVPIDDKIDKESVMKRTFNLNFSGYFMVRAKLIDLGTGRHDPKIKLLDESSGPDLG